MGREILFKAKSGVSGKWVEGLAFNACNMQYIYTKPKSDGSEQEIYEVDPDTICQYTGLMDKNGKKIWENDILMCHDNPVDLVKAVFGEFNVIEVESEEVIDSVIGWHYETNRIRLWRGCRFRKGIRDKWKRINTQCMR